MLDILPSAVMLRAEWMYDYYEKRSNYLMMILNAIHTQDSVSFSSKQFRGITYLKEVAENMDKVILLPGGAYNFGSETTQSIYEVTNKFVDMLGKKAYRQGRTRKTQFVDGLQQSKKVWRGILAA